MVFQYIIMSVSKLFLLLGAILSALSVVIGAFGAHGLEKYLQETGRTETFETAVKYQFYHALALLIVGIIYHLANIPYVKYSGYLLLVGTFIFSGSLYILCMTNVSKWGAVTPIGGLLLIIGWVFLSIGILKSQL